MEFAVFTAGFIPGTCGKLIATPRCRVASHSFFTRWGTALSPKIAVTSAFFSWSEVWVPPIACLRPCESTR